MRWLRSNCREVLIHELETITFLLKKVHVTVSHTFTIPLYLIYTFFQDIPLKLALKVSRRLSVFFAARIVMVTLISWYRNQPPKSCFILKGSTVCQYQLKHSPMQSCLCHVWQSLPYFDFTILTMKTISVCFCLTQGVIFQYDAI